MYSELSDMILKIVMINTFKKIVKMENLNQTKTGLYNLKKQMEIVEMKNMKIKK